MDKQQTLLKLQSWDKKATEPLEELFNQYQNNSQFSLLLIASLEIPNAQPAVTWLIKNRFKQFNFTEPQCEEIILSLSIMQGWEAQLHILQVLELISLTEKTKQPLEQSLRKLIISDNKFVRAWSYYGFYLFADKFEEYRQEVSEFLALGLKDEPASVTARIRKANKQRDW